MTERIDRVLAKMEEKGLTQRTLSVLIRHDRHVS